jgi:hypothetical protein
VSSANSHLSATQPVRAQKADCAILRHRSRPCIAAALSLAVPGSGQLYSGKTLAALIWLPAVFLMYYSSLPIGLVAHTICVVDATQRGPRKNGADEIYVSRIGTYAFGGILFLSFVVVLVAMLALGPLAANP